jgi:hypothetical protein
MADIDLSQSEADALLALEKLRENDERHDFPAMGTSLTVPLRSRNRREQFLLDINTSRIDLLKGGYQNRARQVVVLARLDFGGRPHRNPDGEEIGSPHLHVYREGFGAKWAFPVPSEHFSDPTDKFQALEDFMRYCNIVEPPLLSRDLFA